MKVIWMFNHDACMPDTGPLLRHYYFSKGLTSKGFKTTVFASNQIHFNDVIVDTKGKKFIVKFYNDLPFVYIKTRKYKGNGISRVLNMISYFINLFPATKDYEKLTSKPDVIIGSSVHPLSCVAAILIARRYKVPNIVEIRDLWPEALFSFGKVKEQSILGKSLLCGERWIYENANAIIFTKEGDIDHIKEMKWDVDQGGNIDLKKCFYINNGVDLDEFSLNGKNTQISDKDLTDESFKIIYTGTIRPVNNLDKVLDAAKILKVDSDIKFLIYGYGNELERLSKRVVDENLTNVKFKGYVDKRNVPYILSKASANLLNYSQSKYNWSRGNSSNKLFEYMASGKPIISTIKMGYSIIDKYQCGFTLSEDTSEELARVVLKVKNLDRENYEEICKNAQNGASFFDFKVLTDKLYNVLILLMK